MNSALTINLNQERLFSDRNDAVSAYFLKHDGKIVENEQKLDDIPDRSRLFFSLEIAIKFVNLNSQEFLAQVDPVCFILLKLSRSQTLVLLN
jgi:hypothetical protein